MAERVSAELRLLVAERAKRLCEYCGIAEEDTFFGCEVDHIISVKHGGITEADNLAYACMFCNRYKGSDIASISLPSRVLVRFFNPRTDAWAEHFQLSVLLHITALTEIGEVTARILRFNDVERILERQALNALLKYPSARRISPLDE